MSLQGQSIIVTGGAGGLGLAIAKACLAAGASVTVCDVSQAQLDDLSKSHPEVLARKSDVTSEQDIEALFAAAKEKYGHVDGLVNNAGIMDRFDPVGEVTRAKWDQIMGVNLTGPFLCSQAAVKTFLAQTDADEGKSKGKIVNVASASIHRTLSAGVAYATSKHALIGMTKHTAATYSKQGIRCNAIVPGGMHTNIGAGMQSGDVNQAGMQRMYMTAAMQPDMCSVDEVANLVVFLLDDKAKVVNGAVVNADNAWSCW